MKAKALIAGILAISAAGAFANDQFNGEADYKMPHAVSTKSRAEVLADLEIWRKSGLAEVELVAGGSYNSYDPRYLAAKARYEELHSSPQFASRVQQIARQRGEVVDAGS